MTLTLSYLVFAAASIALTIWVGRALKKHGAILLSAGELGELAGGDGTRSFINPPALSQVLSPAKQVGDAVTASRATATRLSGTEVPASSAAASPAASH